MKGKIRIGFFLNAIDEIEVAYTLNLHRLSFFRNKHSFLTFNWSTLYPNRPEKVTFYALFLKHQNAIKENII